MWRSIKIKFVSITTKTTGLPHDQTGQPSGTGTLQTIQPKIKACAA